MIINKDIHPERKIYYIGALVIDVLRENKEDSINHLLVFEKLQEKESITVDVFMLALDWLFLLGAVKLEQGILKKCF
ncbi:MAG: ABC-three component system middle component 6 [Candidatus Thiodiazotropha endolucinida]